MSASFLEYVPVSLAFGTSGLRGLVKDITDLEAYINVKAALRYFLSIGDIRAGTGVVIGGDLRPSTDRIMRACAQAIIDSGHQLENAGKIPTPALIAHAIGSGRAGVMVSGSHIPFDRNGIKLNKSSGEVLKSDEAGIIREVQHVRAQEYGRSSTASAFDPRGMLKRAPELPPVNPRAEDGYVRRYVDAFAPGGLAGIRVLVYQHSAVGRDILPRILRSLGAEVVTAGRSDSFIPIDTENITADELGRLQELALTAEASSGPVDVIVSTDGDSDRPLVAAVLRKDEAELAGQRIRFLPGDLLGLVVTEYLRADAVAVPISANDAVEQRMTELGVTIRKTKIGSPYVVSALAELCTGGNHSRIVGWEANGGYLTATDIALRTGTVAALPTRDSTLPILATLYAAAEQRVGLCTLWDRLPARFGRAGLIDDMPVEMSQAILSRIVPNRAITEVLFSADGSVFDRSFPNPGASALTPIAATEWQDCKSFLSRFFTPALGFAEIVRINTLDGIRLYFANGDVAHLRPSGNAPQMRIYANSNSQARADQIVHFALREPDGILRQLERTCT